VSFLRSPLSVSGRVDDPDHSLAAGVDMNMPDFDRLLIASPIALDSSF
jgi:hypothetical protein